MSKLAWCKRKKGASLNMGKPKHLKNNRNYGYNNLNGGYKI